MLQVAGAQRSRHPAGVRSESRRRRAECSISAFPASIIETDRRRISSRAGIARSASRRDRAAWLHENLGRVPLRTSRRRSRRGSARASSLALKRRRRASASACPIQTPVDRAGRRHARSSRAAWRVRCQRGSVARRIDRPMPTPPRRGSRHRCRSPDKESDRPRSSPSSPPSSSAIGGGAATCGDRRPQPPGDGWVVHAARPSGGSRGDLRVEFDRAGGAALAKRVMGMDDGAGRRRRRRYAQGIVRAGGRSDGARGAARRHQAGASARRRRRRRPAPMPSLAQIRGDGRRRRCRCGCGDVAARRRAGASSAGGRVAGGVDAAPARRDAEARRDSRHRPAADRPLRPHRDAASRCRGARSRVGHRPGALAGRPGRRARQQSASSRAEKSSSSAATTACASPTWSARRTASGRWRMSCDDDIRDRRRWPSCWSSQTLVHLARARRALGVLDALRGSARAACRTR